MNVDAFLVALSLAVKGAVEDRLRCIYTIAALSDAALMDDDATEDPREVVSRQSVEKILGELSSSN